MFFVPCGIFIKVYRYPYILFNCDVFAIFEASDLKETGVLFFISRITVQCVIDEFSFKWIKLSDNEKNL